MKQTLFITGTDTGVGKTVLTALLTRFLRERGPACGTAALKPICSGSRADARALRAAMNGTLTLNEINPWHFRVSVAPLLAARLEKKSVKLPQVLAHIRAVQKRFDVLLVEGAGGLLSPLGICSGGLRPSPSSALTERRYKKSFNSRDLIVSLHAIPIVVAPNRLGVVNHVMLTLEALPKALRPKACVVLISQPKPDASAKTNAKFLAELTNAKIFSLPWFHRKNSTKSPQVRQILRLLAGI